MIDRQGTPIAGFGSHPFIRGLSMKNSAIKTCAALALATVASAGFAQTYEVPYPSTTTMPPSALDVYHVPPAYRPMPSDCAGLSDRQTERACRGGFSPNHADPWMTPPRDSGGRTDDQAG
jgi:hypothetical protein